MNIMSLTTAMPGAFAQGLIWGIMAIGVYITFRVLDIADLIERAMEEFEEEGKGEVSLEKVIDLDKRVKEYVRQSSI